MKKGMVQSGKGCKDGDGGRGKVKRRGLEAPPPKKRGKWQQRVGNC